MRVDRADWQWVFDDRRVQVADVGQMIAQLEAIEARLAELVPGTEFWLSPLEFFRDFKRTLDRVSLFLLSLAAPTLAMIVAYVMLMAALSVEQRIAEVATLHSRGAGRLQVLASFALEWAVLAGAAALVGPYVGLIAARSVGSTEGFLGFAAIAGADGASTLPLAVTRQSRWFAALASFLAVAAAVGPAAAGGRLSVVTLRQLRARGMRRSFWHRYFIDVIVLGVGFYGYSSLRWQSVRLAPDATIDADPLLFVVPVLFFLGFGLALLRLFSAGDGGIEPAHHCHARRGMAAQLPPAGPQHRAVRLRGGVVDRHGGDGNLQRFGGADAAAQHRRPDPLPGGGGGGGNGVVDPAESGRTGAAAAARRPAAGRGQRAAVAGAGGDRRRGGDGACALPPRGGEQGIAAARRLQSAGPGAGRVRARRMAPGRSAAVPDHRLPGGPGAPP